MTWRRLFTASAIVLAMVVAAVASARPAAAMACGGGSGQLCTSECLRECSNGSCCKWTYTYYVAPE